MDEADPAGRRRASAKERLKQMTFYATGGGCLRAKILHYFGETAEKPFCGNCSGCMAREEERDVSRQAGQIVAAVIAMNGRYGKATVARVLCGQTDAKLRERGLDKLSAFGAMKAEGEANVRAMIDELIAGDVLTVTAGDYPLLQEGAYARDVLRGDMPIRMALLPTDAAPELKRRVKPRICQQSALQPPFRPAPGNRDGSECAAVHHLYQRDAQRYGGQSAAHARRCFASRA